MKILELEEELRYDGFDNQDVSQMLTYGQGCGQQPQVSRGERGEGREEGGELQGPNQEPDCEAQAEHRWGRVCWEIRPEITERGLWGSFLARGIKPINPVTQVDRLEDALMEEQDKHKSISEDLEQAFAEMSGYW